MSILDRFSLTGRVGIVTGASSGLGVSFAGALADSGAAVVVAGRRASRLDETANSIRARGGQALAVQTDVSRPEDCTALVEAAIAEYGRVDVLVNNAGIGAARPATRESPEEFRQVIETNLNGCYWMAQACGRVMRPGSAIINISSVVGLKPQDLPQAAYAASKAGLLGLTRDLAHQWTARKGIRVNAIAPGFFESEMSTSYAEGYVDTQLQHVAMGRQGHPDELAATVLWLASDAGGYVTGQTIVVDGGFAIG